MKLLRGGFTCDVVNVLNFSLDNLKAELFILSNFKHWTIIRCHPSYDPCIYVQQQKLRGAHIN